MLSYVFFSWEGCGNRNPRRSPNTSHFPAYKEKMNWLKVIVDVLTKDGRFLDEYFRTFKLNRNSVKHGCLNRVIWISVWNVHKNIDLLNFSSIWQCWNDIREKSVWYIVLHVPRTFLHCLGLVSRWVEQLRLQAEQFADICGFQGNKSLLHIILFVNYNFSKFALQLFQS